MLIVVFFSSHSFPRQPMAFDFLFHSNQIAENCRKYAKCSAKNARFGHIVTVEHKWTGKTVYCSRNICHVSILTSPLNNMRTPKMMPEHYTEMLRQHLKVFIQSNWTNYTENPQNTTNVCEIVQMFESSKWKMKHEKTDERTFVSPSIRIFVDDGELLSELVNNLLVLTCVFSLKIKKKYFK